MGMRMKEYIFYEVGKVCRAEFLMKDVEFHYTEDAVVIGTSRGQTPQ